MQTTAPETAPPCRSAPGPRARDYLARLNARQREAVEYGIDPASRARAHIAGPLLVIAGAGSGKTDTLAHRVTHLLANGVDPRRILLLNVLAPRRGRNAPPRRSASHGARWAPTPRRSPRASTGRAPSTASARACCANARPRSASPRRSRSTTAKTRRPDEPDPPTSSAARRKTSAFRSRAPACRSTRAS